MSFASAHQRTIAAKASLQGIGVHSGQKATLVLEPAAENTGIIFERSDLTENNRIAGHVSSVVDTRCSTTIANEHGITLSTIEHLMAALAAFQISNVLVKVSGPEMPIMDGSSSAFMDLIASAGVVEQQAARKIIRVLKRVEVDIDGRSMAIEPSADYSFDFATDFYGREGLTPQSETFSFSTAGFAKDISVARSFGFYEDAEKLYAMGLAKGSSLENAVVIRDGQVMNEDGLRYKNEMVRHKILDALGDLYLGGALIQGHCSSFNGGHELNYRALEALLADESAYDVIELETSDLSDNIVAFIPPYTDRPAAAVASHTL